MSARTGGGTLKQKVDRHGQGEGEGLKTGKSVLASFMDDPQEHLSFAESQYS